MRGGKRKNSGRKKTSDPKKQVTLYVKSSIVEKKGGDDVLKEKIYRWLGQKD